MAGFKRSVIINQAIEEVFDVATNLDNASTFLPGVTKIEILTEGGMKPGAKFKETRKGRSAVIEVVEHRRPEFHAASASMMGMRATYWFRFNADPARARCQDNQLLIGVVQKQRSTSSSNILSMRFAGSRWRFGTSLSLQPARQVNGVVSQTCSSATPWSWLTSARYR